MTVALAPSHSAEVAAEGLLDVFEARMLNVWRRGNFHLPDAAGTTRLIRLLLGQEGFGPTRAILAESGVRAEWNRVFAQERSAFLADWLRPHLSPGPVLDVLGGDFTVLRALVGTGLVPSRVHGCERAGAYDVDWASLPFQVDDVTANLRLPGGPFHSALVCTVLHHEPDPGALLDSLTCTGAERWIVVENCVDEANSEAFHLYMDEFFNRCLNEFDVPCVTQHRTQEGWRRMLARYGHVVRDETRDDIPGMPFPYTLFVIERGRR